jgi:hypothetical protein
MFASRRGICAGVGWLAILLIRALPADADPPTSAYADILNGPATEERFEQDVARIMPSCVGTVPCLALADLSDVFRALFARDIPGGQIYRPGARHSPVIHNREAGEILKRARGHPRGRDQDRDAYRCAALVKLAGNVTRADQWPDNQGKLFMMHVLEIAARVRLDTCLPQVLAELPRVGAAYDLIRETRMRCRLDRRAWCDRLNPS